MFITWQDETPNKAGNRHGTVRSRSHDEEAAYHVTLAVGKGAFSKVDVKRGNRKLADGHVVPSDPDKVNGHVLALVRALDAAENADDAPLADGDEATTPEVDDLADARLTADELADMLDDEDAVTDDDAGDEQE